MVSASALEALLQASTNISAKSVVARFLDSVKERWQ
jgi:hypothetical protein